MGLRVSAERELRVRSHGLALEAFILKRSSAGGAHGSRLALPEPSQYKDIRER